jgi:hypothetical protein
MVDNPRPSERALPIGEVANTVKSLAVTVDKFITEQHETNKTVSEAIQASRSSNVKSLAALAVFVLAAWAAQYAFLVQKTHSDVAPLEQLATQNMTSVSALATQTAEQRQKNVEFGTQINCLEIIREFENAVRDRDNALMAMGVVKLQPGQQMPVITYHPLCQPVATVLAK